MKQKLTTSFYNNETKKNEGFDQIPNLKNFRMMHMFAMVLDSSLAYWLTYYY